MSKQKKDLNSELKSHYFSIDLSNLVTEMPSQTGMTRRSAVDAVGRMAAALREHIVEKVIDLGLEGEVDLSMSQTLGAIGLVGIVCTDNAAIQLQRSGLRIASPIAELEVLPVNNKSKSLSRAQLPAFA